MKFVYLLAFAAVVTVTNSQSEDIDCPAWNLPYTKFRYPHPTNCKLYYSCIFGSPYLRSCPRLHGMHLYYDSKLQTCNWSWKVDCFGDATTTTPDVTTTGSSITTEGSTPSVSHDPTTTTPEVTTTGSSITTESSTPSVSHDPTTTTPEVTTTGSSITTESSTPSVSCDPTKSVCPPSGSCKVKHETDCRAYYDCKDGEKGRPICCMENHFFNPIVQACDSIPPPCNEFPVCSKSNTIYEIDSLTR